MAARDLMLDADLRKGADGTRRLPTSHPATLMETVIGLRTAGPNDRGPIIGFSMMGKDLRLYETGISVDPGTCATG